MSSCGEALRAIEIRRGGQVGASFIPTHSRFTLGLIDRGTALCPSVLRNLIVARENS
jgi:hypothetical protein